MKTKLNLPTKDNKKNTERFLSLMNIHVQLKKNYELETVYENQIRYWFNKFKQKSKEIKRLEKTLKRVEIKHGY